MDNSTLISLAALVVAFLALPTSYFVAVHQVKVGLDELERRSKQTARLLVADRLDEFYRVFYSAVEQFTGIGHREAPQRLSDIAPHLQEIDKFVGKTGALDRLASEIDNLAAIRYADIPKSSDLVTRLQSIRGQIALGSDATRYATAGVIAASADSDLQSALRNT